MKKLMNNFQRNTGGKSSCAFLSKPELHQSKNPDLLFPDIMAERSVRAIRYVVGHKNDLPRRLDRVTAIITRRCNFRCPYCNGPHTGFNKTKLKQKKEMMSRDLNFKEFKKLMADWTKIGLVQIHFTGGEPTLNKDLLQMVKLSTKNNVLSSITTNGSADISLYRALIDAGMTEIRVSIDAFEEDDYDLAVGVKGRFDTVVGNIKAIVAMRDIEKKDIFLVLNTCVGEMNIEKSEKLLKFLINLGPDDIKFLVIAMEKETLSRRASQEILDRLNRVLSPYPMGKFPLLRDKIEKLFDPDSMGLKDKKTQQVMEHCYVPATERTITPLYYYPCSIYLRGYGKPLGKISDSFRVQQEKIMAFVLGHDCRKDKLCKRMCTNCTKLFNVQASEEIKKLKEIRVDKIFTKAEILKEKQRILALRKGKAKKRWFFIIKPMGLKYQSQMIKYLESRGIKITGVHKVHDWHSLALPLYRSHVTNKKVEFAMYRQEAFRKIEGDAARLLFLDNVKSEKWLLNLKKEMREIFSTPRYLAITHDHKDLIEPHMFHIPDEHDLKRENAIISHFIN